MKHITSFRSVNVSDISTPLLPENIITGPSFVVTAYVDDTWATGTRSCWERWSMDSLWYHQAKVSLFHGNWELINYIWCIMLRIATNEWCALYSVHVSRNFYVTQMCKCTYCEERENALLRRLFNAGVGEGGGAACKSNPNRALNKHLWCARTKVWPFGCPFTKDSYGESDKIITHLGNDVWWISLYNFQVISYLILKI